MPNVQKMELKVTDYYDKERELFVIYSRNIERSSGYVRVLDVDNDTYWNCRIVSIRYMKAVHLYKYELEKM